MNSEGFKSHNAPYLPPPPPPPIFHEHFFFSIPLGRAVTPRRNEKQRLCIFFGGGAGGIRCIM